MLGNFIYSEEVADSPGKYAAPQKVEKAARRILLLAAIVIGGGLIWLLFISPCMMPVKMDIDAVPGLGKAEVLYYAGIPGGATFVSINVAEAERLLSRHHLLESVKITKRFPDRLSIYLEPRKAAAMTLFSINGRTQPVYLDRHGVVFKIGNEAGEKIPARLPVVSGVLSDALPPRLGMKVPAAYLPVFSQIGAISDEDPNIWQAISEIGITHKNSEVFDLLLYPAHNPIKLRMGNDLKKEKIYYALVMSEVYSQMGSGIPSEIDVRSGLGVIAREDGNGK